ncbi:MAG: tetratricopeptide repeat protein [Syntrophobacteraceae bacterium]|nr:tetratricopeptide repeat protein [Syntrophobacteraceae bacterium]
MKTKVTAGIVLLLLGVGLLIYYDFCVRPEEKAREMMTEARMIYERGDKDAINQAINIYTKVIARYPASRLIPEAYYYIGLCYEKIGLNRLAFLKYSYLIKNRSPHMDAELRKEVLIRLAHLNVLKQYSEEGMNQLYGLLNENYNPELRSRIYSELGHTYLKSGEYGRSRRMFDIALSEYGSNEEALIGKARSYKRLGYDNYAYDLYDHFLKYYGAVSQYTADVRASYKNQAYRSGLDAFRRGDYWNAVSFFNRVLRHFGGERISENAMYWTGESYFAMRRFDNAISFFNRTLENSFYHKDQDAQIKKGYAYFLDKRFDLAAREFQTYLKNYPGGRHAATAREWKNMSTKELLYRIESKKVPDAAEEDGGIDEGEEKRIDSAREGDEEVAGDFDETGDVKGIELENVAEL